MLNLGHFLLRYKRALSFALPAVVCLDACHNAYVVYKLYEEREKEWAMEDQQTMLDQVLPMMRGVASACQIKDKAFWPPIFAQALALPMPCEAVEEVAAFEEEDGPLGMLGLLPRLISAKDCQASSDLDKRDHSRTQPSSSADGSKSSACSAGVPQPVALYGRALQWLADQAQRATELGHSYIDGMVDRGLRLLRESIPVPCMVVRRRSALRVRLHWHGFAQPVGKPRAVQTCEVYL